MCCLITSLFLLGPRFATLIWWLINSVCKIAAYRLLEHRALRQAAHLARVESWLTRHVPHS